MSLPQQELVVLRTKVSKLEEETNSLTEQNAQLTAKTEDLEVHLQEERENSAQVGFYIFLKLACGLLCTFSFSRTFLFVCSVCRVVCLIVFLALYFVVENTENLIKTTKFVDETHRLQYITCLNL